MLLTLKVLITPDSTEGVDSNQKTALKNTSGENDAESENAQREQQ